MVFIFFVESELCSLVDDTTIYSGSLNYNEAILKLSNETHIVRNCFRIKKMVANPVKS